MQIHMQRWLLEFPATMRNAALTHDFDCGLAAMSALQQHYHARTVCERQGIYLSLARTILEDLDRDSFNQVEDFLLEVGLLHKQRA
jgi:hypothetical protein